MFVNKDIWANVFAFLKSISFDFLRFTIFLKKIYSIFFLRIYSFYIYFIFFLICESESQRFTWILTIKR